MATMTDDQRIRRAAKKRGLTVQNFPYTQHYRIGEVLDYWPETGSYWVRPTDHRGKCREIGNLLEALTMTIPIPDAGRSKEAT